MIKAGAKPDREPTPALSDDRLFKADFQALAA
jgi:hypothetical protein